MDWLERKDKNNYCPLINKPCAMVSAGYSMRGGRSQKHFTEVLECKKMKVLKPS
jgi:NAD(P)H-dependent FMN reductase